MRHTIRWSIALVLPVALMAAGLLQAGPHATTPQAKPMALLPFDRARTEANMREILRGVTVYATEHNGNMPTRLPDDLVEVLGGEGTAKQLWSNPARAEQNPPFVYIKAAAKVSQIRDAGKTVILYEAYATWTGGAHVGYADGRVEWITDEPIFKKMTGKR